MPPAFPWPADTTTTRQKARSAWSCSRPRQPPNEGQAGSPPFPLARRRPQALLWPQLLALGACVWGQCWAPLRAVSSCLVLFSVTPGCLARSAVAKLPPPSARQPRGYWRRAIVAMRTKGTRGAGRGVPAPSCLAPPLAAPLACPAPRRWQAGSVVSPRHHAAVAAAPWPSGAG